MGTASRKEKIKNRLKWVLGVASRVIVDAEVLLGNKNDKIYNGGTLKRVEFQTVQGKVNKYFIREKECIYENTKLKCAICYSISLERIKKKAIERCINKKKQVLKKLTKTYTKRAFACKEDANKEIIKLKKKDLKKYHDISITTYIIEKRKRRRQPKDTSKIQNIQEYYIQMNIKIDEEKVQKQFEEACTFVLCSNDLNLKAEEILKEYKTQSGV